MKPETVIKRIRKRMAMLRSRREAEIEAVRAKYRPSLESLAERLQVEIKGRPKRGAFDRYLESAKTPMRICKGCGEEMLTATVENALRVNQRVAVHLEQEQVELVKWTDLRRLHSDEYCCYWCKKSPGGEHSNRCSSLTQIQETEAEEAGVA